MNSQRQLLAKKNRWRRLKAERFDAFKQRLAPLVSFDVKAAGYSSFESTQEMLARVRSIAETERLDWTCSNSHSFSAFLECAASRLAEAPVECFLSTHFYWVGSVALAARVAIECIDAFFSIGEESILLTSGDSANSLFLDRSEGVLGAEYDYLVRVSGEEWLLLLRDCVPEQTRE